MTKQSQPKKPVEASAAETTPDQSKSLEAAPRSIGEIIPDVLAGLQRLSEKSAARRIEMEKFVVRKPKVIPCPHGGTAHWLDLDESSRASWPDGPFQLVYKPCKHCLRSGQEDWLSRAGVPKLLLKATLDNWQPRTEEDETSLEIIKRFTLAGSGFLILSGSVGLGKSHLAVGVMRERRCGRFITQNTLLLKLRERYRSDYAEDVLEKCKSARFLVLDEFGSMTGSRDELPALYEIINHRHGEQLPMVLTTNIAFDQFSEVFGDKIADRLRCHQPFVSLCGDSWRGK